MGDHWFNLNYAVSQNQGRHQDQTRPGIWKKTRLQVYQTGSQPRHSGNQIPLRWPQTGQNLQVWPDFQRVLFLTWRLRKGRNRPPLTENYRRIPRHNIRLRANWQWENFHNGGLWLWNGYRQHPEAAYSRKVWTGIFRDRTESSLPDFWQNEESVEHEIVFSLRFLPVNLQRENIRPAQQLFPQVEQPWVPSTGVKTTMERSGTVHSGKPIYLWVPNSRGSDEAFPPRDQEQDYCKPQA